jgi:hypothetical protein
MVNVDGKRGTWCLERKVLILSEIMMDVMFKVVSQIQVKLEFVSACHRCYLYKLSLQNIR